MVNQLGLLEHIRDRLSEYEQMTVEDLIAEGARSPSGGAINLEAGQHRHQLALWMVQLQEAQLEEHGIQIKTVRLKADSKPAEDMSFKNFKYMGPGGVTEQDWDSPNVDNPPPIKLEFQQPIVIAIFVNADRDGAHMTIEEQRRKVKFDGSVLWKMPKSDLEGRVRPVWELTKQVILDGSVRVRRGKEEEEMAFPTSGELEDRTFFVRTKGRDSRKIDETPRNGLQPKRGFDLGREYVQQQIASARRKYDSGWPPWWEVLDADEELLSAEQELEAQSSFDMNNMSDNRKITMRAIVSRMGQGRFREDVLDAYGGRCAVTGYSSRYALEACHIIPYLGDETNHVNNGILLRADIHTLFDLGKIAINSSDMTVVLSPELLSTEYENLNRKHVLLPEDSAKKPDVDALNQHRKGHGL